MEKTIKIGDKDVRLNNNVGWTLAYRDQFGRDILPAIMPILWSVTEAIGAILREETGLVFAKVLAHAGVYKRTEEGRAAFERFVTYVNAVR